MVTKFSRVVQSALHLVGGTATEGAEQRITDTIERGIKYILEHTSDNSLRDGNQSWLANNLPPEDLTKIRPPAQLIYFTNSML